MSEVNPACYSELANLQALVNIQQGQYGTPLQTGLNLSDLTDKAVARINLGIDASTLPASDPHVSGQEWNDNGFRKISSG